MEQSITYKNLVDTFREIGIENGLVLEVHCPLTSFGR